LPQLDPVIIYSQVWGIFLLVAIFFIYNLVVSQADSYELNRGGAKVGRFFVPEQVILLAFSLTILTTFAFAANASLLGKN